MRKLEGGVFRWLRTKKLKSRTSGAAEAAEGGRSPRIKTKKPNLGRRRRLRVIYRINKLRISNSIGRGLPCHGSRCRFDAGLVRFKEKSPLVGLDIC